MQYSGNSTGQDIVSLSNLLSKQNDTSFPLTEKTVFANMGNRLILSEIHNAYGGWKYDDRNNTDFPIATTDLTSGQTDYSLPIDIGYLNAVYWKDSAGNWEKLIPLTLEDINRKEAEPEFENENANPTYYRPIGNSIKIYPASDTTVEDGLMIEYTRDISTFATTDTTKTPGFDVMFHEALAVYIAYQFAQINQTRFKESITAQWVDYLARIKRHYSQKYKDLYPTRIKIDYKFNEYI